MAKPDCDDGYYKLSYELGAALFSFGFGEIEGHIIGLVLEAQYGFGKRKFVELSPASLSAEWEVPRQNIHRAIGNLVARNVLLPLGDNRYQFLKDYENWDKKGRPARVLLWKAFVADAPRRAKSIRPLPPPRERDDLILEGVPGVNDEPEPVISKDDTSSTADESPSSSKMTTRHLQRLPTVIFKDDEQGVPPGPPIEEARAECKKGRSEEEECVGYTHTHARESQAQPTPTPELVAFIEAKVIQSCKDGIFAADFSHGFAVRWLGLAGGDEELVKQAAYAFAQAGVGSRGIPSYAESFVRRKAAQRAAQPETIPITASRPAISQPARLSPAQQRMQDQWDAFKELERKAKEGA